MASPRSRRPKKPSKPFPSFPLTAHNNGQWCKKIRGKVHFFGVWGDPNAALANYHRVAADLHAGRQPTPLTLSADNVMVKDVCNHFLTYQLRRANGGEITMRWFWDCRSVLDSFAKVLGPSRSISELTPEDFQSVRDRFVRSGLTGKGAGLGTYALDRAITVIKGALAYAWEMDLIDKPVKYGKGFQKPSAAQKRKSQQAAEAVNGKRILTPVEIRHMVEKAEMPLRAMILLGINGGFGNTDCSCLVANSIDLQSRIIEFPRRKTGIPRTVPLWPETADSLKEAMETRGKPKDSDDRDLVFLTAAGEPWIRQKVHGEGDISRKLVIIDDICRSVAKLLRQLAIKRKSLGFYALRHTFRTWADEVRDPHAIFRIMGHAIPGMAGVYVEEISLDRLRAVTDHVRARVFPT